MLVTLQLSVATAAVFICVAIEAWPWSAGNARAPLWLEYLADD